MANRVFFKPCPEVFIQVSWLRVVVKVLLNAKITDPSIYGYFQICIDNIPFPQKKFIFKRNYVELFKASLAQRARKEVNS